MLVYFDFRNFFPIVSLPLDMIKMICESEESGSFFLTYFFMLESEECVSSPEKKLLSDFATFLSFSVPRKKEKTVWSRMKLEEDDQQLILDW